MRQVNSFYLFVAMYILFYGPCLAADLHDGRGIYFGIFGGGGSSSGSSMQQIGALEPVNKSIPNIPINGNGSAGGANASMGGAQLGYEWRGWNIAQSGWILNPAAEIEGLYLNSNSDGELTVNLHAKLIHYLHLTLIHPNDDVIFR